VDGFLKYFPKKPYEHQIDVMRKIEEALREERIVLFEGACGTGKTIVSLATSLSTAEEMGKKVLVATNVHQQMLQFVEELKEIKKKVGDLKVTVLKGKTHLCPDRKSYEECEKLIEEEKCERYPKTSQTKIESFTRWYFSDVRFPEEVMEKERDCCPYELLKRCMSLSDVIVCNYHHVLNPEIFMRLLNWCSCDVRDLIVIFDEAHNLESSAREHSSIFLREEVVKGAIREAEEMGEEEFARLIRDLDSAILEMVDERRMDRGLEEELFLDGGDELLVVEEMYEISFEGAENLRTLSDFMISWRYFSGDPSYAFVIRINEREGYILEIFSCIPKKVTKPLFDSVSAAILMSATLRPFEVLREVLGIERETAELVVPSPFPKRDC